MAQVYIPTLLQQHTGGVGCVEIAAVTAGATLFALVERFPALGAHLLDKQTLRPGIAIAIDGEVALHLSDPVADNSEVHFVMAIRGGS